MQISGPKEYMLFSEFSTFLTFFLLKILICLRRYQGFEIRHTSKVFTLGHYVVTFTNEMPATFW